ncbi:hypothetical protein ACJX0J_013754, partial [Zea mays]
NTIVSHVRMIWFVDELNTIFLPQPIIHLGYSLSSRVGFCFLDEIYQKHKYITCLAKIPKRRFNNYDIAQNDDMTLVSLVKDHDNITLLDKIKQEDIYGKIVIGWMYEYRYLLYYSKWFRLEQPMILDMYEYRYLSCYLKWFTITLIVITFGLEITKRDFNEVPYIKMDEVNVEIVPQMHVPSESIDLIAERRKNALEDAPRFNKELHVERVLQQEQRLSLQGTAMLLQQLQKDVASQEEQKLKVALAVDGDAERPMGGHKKGQG